MTLSNRIRTQSSIKTLINLSTSKRTFMVLSNPDEIHKDDWYVHVSIFGVSFVYFSLNTPVACYEDEFLRCIGWPNTVAGRQL